MRLRDTGRLLLSAEDLSTRICNPQPWEGFDDGAYWDHRRRYLARLRCVLPESAQVEVFVCFREHEAYAHALYATKLLSGRIEWSFPQFVRRCAPIFDYRRQVDVLAQALGTVHVKSYENLRDGLANRMFAWLGVPIRVECSPRLNPTPTLDLIHWLATAVRSQPGDAEREQRAAFCRAYQSSPAQRVRVSRACGHPSRTGRISSASAIRHHWRTGRQCRRRATSPTLPRSLPGRMNSKPSTGSGKKKAPMAAASTGCTSGAESRAVHRQSGLR